MKRNARLNRFRSYAAASLAVAMLIATSGNAQAQQFLELVRSVPHSANAVVILHVEKAKQSPAGVSGGLAAKMEQAFRDGLICVPPGATRFVLASQIDLEFMSAVWEAAVMDLAESPNMGLVAKAYHGESDTIEGLPAVLLPNDAYVVKLGDKSVGAMSPANRQAVVRWVRDMKSNAPPKPSPYLERAAGYSDRVGTEIIMALDLDGLISPQRLQKQLQAATWLEESKVDRAKLAASLMSVQGIRAGVILGEPPSGRITVDFKQDVSLPAAVAKRLFLDYLTEKGVLIEDFNNWKAEVQGKEASLFGTLSNSGLRKMLSVIESPVPSGASPHDSAASIEASASAAQATKTKAYFKAVTALFDDLKEDMREASSLASTTQYFDKYARRIERMPLLDVDPEMLDYGAYVAQQLRQSSGAVRTMGIRKGVREREITSGNSSGSDSYYYGGYGYGRYGSGGVPGMVNNLKDVEQQRGIVRAQEKGSMAASVQQIRADVIAVTADIRRKMTEKYQVQF